MKLLYITNGINGVGGLERVLSIKTKQLIDNYDYKIHIAGLNDSVNDCFYNFHSNIKRHSIVTKGRGLKYLLYLYLGIRDLIKASKPDIIIVCDDGMKAFFYPLLFGKKSKIVYERHVSLKILENENNNRIRNFSAKIKRNLMINLAKRFDAFVVLNEENKKEWKQNNNIRIIENMLPFYPELESKLINKKVIAVGKQSYQKNYERMINVWKQIHEIHPEWELHIYGKEDKSLNLQTLINNLELDNIVYLHSPTKDILNKYLESSLYLMTSRYEGMPMVLLEAMAAGLPCISVDCPHGPKQLIKDNLNGFLIEYDSNEELVNKISEVISNENLRKKLSNGSRDFAMEFSPLVITKKWDILFKSIYKNDI